MKKNNKGFTLIELLAVIVVLAIIMVIATTQINNTIKKSRADSFYDSVQMIERNADILCAQNSSISVSELADISEIEHDGDNITDEDYTIEISGSSVTVTAKANGQFDNVDLTKYYHIGDSGNGDKVKNSVTNVAENSMTFTADCSVTTTQSESSQPESSQPES